MANKVPPSKVIIFEPVVVPNWSIALILNVPPSKFKFPVKLFAVGNNNVPEPLFVRFPDPWISPL